ncbi:MAG: 30S ribosomal protein S6 [Bryobacteraceae bacterium]|nr:30S ribosomal protein S6 [Bryobacteraceae bacterium]MDW8376875.1 30S ribosomal protein S6 [Bryobacterales bacterium]
MRIYEELFILKPDVTEEEIDAVIEQIRSTVAAGGGTVEKVDKWGKRRLAYKVRKCTEGIYVLMVFSAPSETVKEIERRLRVSDSVIRFLTVRIDEKLKWLEKRKKMREKRAARKPAVAQPAAVAQPGAPLPGAPAAPMPGAPVPAQAAAPSESAPEAPAQ